MWVASWGIYDGLVIWLVGLSATWYLTTYIGGWVYVLAGWLYGWLVMLLVTWLLWLCDWLTIYVGG